MGRLRIGLLTDDLEFEDTYQDYVVQTSVRVAERLGFDLLVFPGHGGLQPVRRGQWHIPLNRMASADILDGLIVSPTASYALSAEERAEVLSRTRELPTVTFALPLGDLPLISIDNRPGVRQMLEHLIHVHGLKRIAEIRSPSGHQEGLERHETWKQVLQEQGLPHDENWSIEGNFEILETRRILESLWTSTGGFDALFCFNDELAIDALEVLGKLGLKVPEQVAVCGYDNIGRSRSVLPPLTTVHQPVGEQIEAAFLLLLSRLRGEQPGRDSLSVRSDGQQLPSSLLVRGSCGCPQRLWTLEPFDSSEHPEVQPILAGDEAALLGWLGRSPPEAVVGLVADRMAQRQPPMDPNLIHRADRYSWDRCRRRLVELEQRIDRLQSLERHLTLEQNRDELHRRLVDDVELLGFRFLSLSLVATDDPNETGVYSDPGFEQTHIPAPPPSLVPFLSVPTPVADASPFRSSRLCPDSWWDNYPGGPLAVLPLMVEPQWYGLLVVDLAEDNSVLVRGFQEHLAAHFDRKHHFRRLVRERIDQEVRVGAEKEKMRALTTLVTGVAHEVNTPVGNGITMVTYLQELLTTWAGNSAHEPIQQAKDGLELILRSLEKTGDLVRVFKKVAISHQSDEIADFDLAEQLRDVLSSLKNVPEIRSLTIRSAFSPGLSVRTLIAPWGDILQQLLMNASLHAYRGTVGGDVLITAAESSPGQIEVVVADQGAGIEPAALTRVFEPFYTTLRRNGNTGLGLHIVYNQVTEGLGGTIVCQSTAGAGTRFILKFPARRSSAVSN